MLTGKEAVMSPECPYSTHHDCDRWLDYQIALLALEDARALADENWNEINFLLDRVEQLETLLRSAGIEVPSAY